MSGRLNRTALDKLYLKYNRREFVHPDPLEFLYNYKNKKDREIVGMIASSLAYGRVQQILKSVSIVLEKIGPSPFEFVTKSSDKKITDTFTNFKHRFHTCKDISALLIGIKKTIKKYGSLEKCFLFGMKGNDRTIEPALGFFVKEISCGSGSCILSLPEKGSACKRLNLFLRWMIRSDNVDPGGWDNVPASKLIVPLDTHMHKIALNLGLTLRKQANMKTAIEITEGFGKISPKDPVKYDFSLTRFGIRSDMDTKNLKDWGLTI